jgi:4-hydroxyphenylpyruvate dioxygenase
MNDKTIHSGLVTGWENPLGTDGFEFLEFASPEPERLAQLFTHLGFERIAKHKSKKIQLFRQGEINFILNHAKNSFIDHFRGLHGPCACAMGFRVKNAKNAYELALKRGAEPVQVRSESMHEGVPAIYGIGNSIIYFIDDYAKGTTYDHDFDFEKDKSAKVGIGGLTYLDHVTHNVYQGHMDQWAGFYEKLFNFKEIRYFDIEGKLTGLKSRAMTSPCGKIRIPINESSDDKSQIAEFLAEYHGEGIQHIALGTNDIYKTVEALRDHQVKFLDTPNTYYEKVGTRVKGHQENIERLKSLKILMDGAPTEGQGLLLQIFTENMIGPIFFEIIQRKGNEGFGEGNFKALFEAIELDQIKRGVLSEE